MKRIRFVGKDGWPVERISGRWFTNFLRILIHTRSIVWVVMLFTLPLSARWPQPSKAPSTQRWSV